MPRVLINLVLQPLEISHVLNLSRLHFPDGCEIVSGEEQSLLTTSYPCFMHGNLDSKTEQQFLN